MITEQIALKALAVIFDCASTAIATRHLSDYFPPEIDAIRDEAREAILAIKHHRDMNRMDCDQFRTVTR